MAIFVLSSVAGGGLSWCALQFETLAGFSAVVDRLGER